MCRIFGFRSVIQSQVHRSLVTADNALQSQSQFHPDGWGVSYYIMGTPHVVKSTETAMNDHIFKKVSGVVSSQTVLAHIRNSTLGSNTILNTHPFQYGHWVFAHNGNIKDFNKYRTSLIDKISPNLRPFILGETDSEIIFYSILSKLEKKIALDDKNFVFAPLAESVREALDEVCQIVGDFCHEDKCGEDETYLTFVMTNGSAMISHQGGKSLYYSTHKRLCPDRDSCTSFAPVCEMAAKTGAINHMIFSSEELKGDNIWNKMKPGEIVGVDSKMQIHCLKT